MKPGYLYYLTALLTMVITYTPIVVFSKPVPADGIDIRLKFPEKVISNQVIIVTMEVTKADLQGPAIISLKFPAGFKGLSLVSGDVEFRVENQYVVLTFSKLPAAETFTITYQLQVGNLKPAVYPVSIDFYDPNLRKHSFNSFIRIDGKMDEPGKPAGARLSVLKNSRVNITLIHPDSAMAGKNFPIRMVIRKGSYAGAMKITQRVPPGFSVNRPTNVECDFFPGPGEAVINLLKSKPDSVFIIEYSMSVGNYAVGKYPVTGFYSDEEGNSTEFMSSVSVINEAKAKIPKAAKAATPEYTVILAGGYEALPGTEHEMKFYISKHNYVGFGRLMQIFPTGITPLPQNTESVSFSVSGNIIKAVWEKMPSESTVEIAYKVMISSGYTGNYPILGIFETSEGKIEFENTIAVKTQWAADKEPVYQEKKISKTETTDTEPVIALEHAKEKSNPPLSAHPAKTVLTNTVIKQELLKPPGNEPVEKQINDSEKIIYRVQVFISQKQQSQDALEQKTGLKGPFYEYIDKGVFKYTIGEFSTSQAGKNFIKEEIGPKIKDAFLVGFKDGVRVP